MCISLLLALMVPAILPKSPYEQLSVINGDESRSSAGLERTYEVLDEDARQQLLVMSA